MKLVHLVTYMCMSKKKVEYQFILGCFEKVNNKSEIIYIYSNYNESEDKNNATNGKWDGQKGKKNAQKE